MKKQPKSRTSIVALLEFFFLTSALLFSGCGHFASQPLDILYYTGDKTSHNNLFVFVRGLGGSHRSFAEEGIVEATWQRDIDFDMVAPNSHFAYYSERTLIERLLATALPADHITRMAGRHDYETFKALWLRFLEWDVKTEPLNPAKTDNKEDRAFYDTINHGRIR